MQKNLIFNLLRTKNWNKKNQVILNYPYMSLFEDRNNENFFLNKRWGNTNNIYNDYKILLELYKKILRKLCKYLNKVHNKKHNKEYWENIIGTWLYTFLSITYERFLSLKYVDKKFANIKVNFPDYDWREFVPYGIEDFRYYTQSSFWNDYIYFEILKYVKFRSIKYNYTKNKLKNFDKKDIEKKISKNNVTFIDKILHKFQLFIIRNNFNLKFFIFNTYLKLKDELHLNFLLNKKIFYFNSIKINYFFDKLKLDKNLDINKRLNDEKQNKFSLEKFLIQFCIKNLPKFYLERFLLCNAILETLKMPTQPKKIFTTLGISRNTLNDIYISNTVDKGSKLIVAQHGGVYGQSRIHWETIHEHNISHKFLSWGFKFNNKTKQLGYIKNRFTKKKKLKKKIILLEIRSRRFYSSKLSIDAGAINNYLYIKNICDFLINLKDKNILDQLNVKLHHKTYNSLDRKLLKQINKRINFLDTNLKTKDFFSCSKILIYTSISTGHIEGLIKNVPTLILLEKDIDLFENKTKKYLIQFKELKILHDNYFSLIEHLQKINENPEKWWKINQIQELRKRYLNDFAIVNTNLKKDIFKILKS